MRRIPTLSAALLAAAMILAGTGCSYLKSRDHINQGIASYRNAKYSDAVDHFEKAIQLDPNNPTPRMYLATAYMVQWIPGAESPENLEFARKAKEEFLKVLDKDPNEKTALAYLATLAFNQALSLPLDEKLKMFDEAAKWQHRRLEVDPKEKEAYYTLGVIAYQKWIPALMTARSNLRMRPEDPGPLKDKKVKEELKAQYGAIVDEGMTGSQQSPGDRSGIRRRHGVPGTADARARRPPGQPGRVQETDGDRRRLAAEGLGYQEDQGCPRRQATDRDPHRKTSGQAGGIWSGRQGVANASIHWYHWMPPESTDAVPPPAQLPVAALAEPPPSVETLYRGLEAHLRETRPKEDLAPLERAYRFAAERHLGQTRVSGEPYMTHPLLVTRQLADMNMDMVCLQTGLLHDVVEDTSATLEEVRKEFGDEVARCVDGVTKLSKLDLASREERQAESVRKMLLAMVDDIRVILVKLADRLHNMRTLGSLPEEKRLRIAQETMDIYAPIAHRLGMGKVRSELEDLAFRYLEPEASEGLLREFEAARPGNEAFLNQVKHIVEVNLAREGIPARVETRVKRAYSVFQEAQAPENRPGPGLRSSRRAHHYRFRSRTVTRLWASFTTSGIPSPAGSRILSPSRGRISTSPCTRPSWAPKAAISKSRSAPMRCTASPRRASRRTGSTKKAAAAPPMTISASPGSASWSNGSAICAIPASSCPP